MSFEIEKLEGMNEEILKICLQEGVTTIAKLRELNIYISERLVENGIPPEEVRTLIKSIENHYKKQFEEDEFITGDELLEQFHSRLFLKTLQPSFDKILEGGLETSKLWEIYGAPGAGKTSLLHQLTCQAALPLEKGGLNNLMAIYLDCENALSLKRLEIMAQFWGVDFKQLINRLQHVQLETVEELAYFTEERLPELVSKTRAKFIMLDSVAVHFRAEYGNRVLLNERSTIMGRIAQVFRTIFAKHNALIIATNQLSVDKCYGGHTWGHAVQARLRIKSDGDIVRTINVEKSIDHSTDLCELIMTEWGLLGKEVFKLKRDDRTLTMDEIHKILS